MLDNDTLKKLNRGELMALWKNHIRQARIIEMFCEQKGRKGVCQIEDFNPQHPIAKDVIKANFSVGAV